MRATTLWHSRWQFAIAIAIALVAAWLTLGQATGDDDFKPRTVINRPFKEIVDAPTISAAEADKLLNPNELVLGVSVGGRRRAYPINMLTGPSREIINDQLGGSAIAATW